MKLNSVAQMVEALRYKPKGPGSIPVEVIDVNLPAELWLNHPLTEMSTRIMSWGWCIAYHLHVPTDLKSGNLKLLELSGPV
jgi:hypothetical protein